ncbi:hypothetical protein QHL1GM_06100 [Halomonas sp. QHL1]|nr:hypothetical protein QHL1GM_06100 [Halomonas sp. QHL1]
MLNASQCHHGLEATGQFVITRIEPTLFLSTSQIDAPPRYADDISAGQIDAEGQALGVDAYGAAE